MSPLTVGIEVDVIDEPVPAAAPVATDTVFLVHSAAVGEPDVVELRSPTDARDEYPGSADIIACADAFFGEGGGRMVVSKLGVDDLPVALARFTADHGPGQVVAPEVVTSALHVTLADWAWATNRIALLNGPDGSTAAALVTLADAVIVSEGARNAALHADTLIIPGTAGGTTREVSATIVHAGIIARTDLLTSNPNTAAAGLTNGRCQYAIGIADERSDADRETLAAGQVNTFKNVYGTALAAYDFVSLADLDALPHWWDLTGSRTVMAVRAREAAVAEAHLFGTIDGGGQFLARYEGALRGELAQLQRIGALYGSDTSPGYRVDVSQVVNPIENLAVGNVTALVVLRTSPFGRSLQVNIVRRSILREV